MPLRTKITPEEKLLNMRAGIQAAKEWYGMDDPNYPELSIKNKKKTIKKNIAETHTDLMEDKRTHKKSVETSVDYDKDLSPKILRAINKSINEAVRIALQQHLSGKGMKEECYYSSSDEEPPKPKAKPRGRPKNIKLT